MFKYLLLGLFQGLTEFLPVSSSGHLVIMQKVFDVGSQDIALLLFLHLGTIASLVAFFFKEILGLIKDKRSLLLILVTTLVTGAIGIVAKDFFEGLFSSVKLVALSLCVTGIILISTRKFMDCKHDKLSFKDAVILGITQAIAIIPGISRSGITISTLIFRRINRELSFKFAFLVSIPVIIGASLLEAGKINSALQIEFKGFMVGFFFSFLSGLFALWVLKRVLIKAKLHYFGYYCILIAIIVLLFIR